MSLASVSKRTTPVGSTCYLEIILAVRMNWSKPKTCITTCHHYVPCAPAKMPNAGRPASCENA